MRDSDPQQKMTIREVCDAFDVTPRTLRYYEAEGLITPERQGTARHYAARDLGRLKLILRGKRFGFSLAEIRELLELYAVGDQQVTQLKATLVTARGKLLELERRETEIGEAIADLKAQMTLVQQMLIDRGAGDAPAAG